MAIRRKKAAEWLIRLEDPEISFAELVQWEAWMNRSPRNRQAFRDMEQLSTRIQEYRADLKIIPVPSRREREADRASPNGYVTRRPGRSARAAMRGKWDLWSERPVRTRRAATLAGMVIALAVLAYFIGSRIMGPGETESMHSYHTAVSEHRSIVLPDGSAIAMGGESSLSVNFSPERRIVMLESGEALFEVAEEGKRPFVVMAGAGTITALGTAFNVRRDGTRVVVTVTEGSVEVKRITQGSRSESWGREPARLPTATTISAGGQAIVSPTQLSVIELNDPAIATEWRAGQMQYRAEPLKYVVAGVSRYSTKEIIIVDTEVENMLFTGSVFQDQTEDWLQALEVVFPVEVDYVGDSKVLIRSRVAVKQR